jgi:hypothetical protein
VATAISAENFKTALGECYDAIAASNITSARKWYALAEIQHAGLPSSGQSGSLAATRRQDLAAVKKAIDTIAASGGNSFEVHSRWVL